MNGTAIEAPCTGGVTASKYHWHIASVPDDQSYDIDWRANARLIAAAPDLLAACQAFLALWPEVADGSKPAHPDVRMVVESCRAAIQKATSHE